METRARASGEQFATLLEYMETHGDLSRPQGGPQGRRRAETLWAEVAASLNAVGGGVTKTVVKWKKVWADWKSKTKKKYVTSRQHANGTGGGPYVNSPLTSFEERVLAIMGAVAVEGQAGVREIGLAQSSLPILVSRDDVQIEILNIESMPSPPAAPLSPRGPSPPPEAPLPSQRASTRRRRASPSPSSAVSSPLRSRPRPRRRLRQTPFERASSDFVAVEQRRLQLEEQRERARLELEHRRLQLEEQRESARLELDQRRLQLEEQRESSQHELETRRIDVQREHNELLRALLRYLENQTST